MRSEGGEANIGICQSIFRKDPQGPNWGKKKSSTKLGAFKCIAFRNRNKFFFSKFMCLLCLIPFFFITLLSVKFFSPVPSLMTTSAMVKKDASHHYFRLEFYLFFFVSRQTWRNLPYFRLGMRPDNGSSEVPLIPP